MWQRKFLKKPISKPWMHKGKVTLVLGKLSEGYSFRE